MQGGVAVHEIRTRGGTAACSVQIEPEDGKGIRGRGIRGKGIRGRGIVPVHEVDIARSRYQRVCCRLGPPLIVIMVVIVIFIEMRYHGSGPFL